MTLRFPVTDDSHVGELRRRTIARAAEMGFSEVARARVGLVATEIGTNLVRHAVGGEVLVRTLAPSGLELLAIDRGPGIADLDASLRDGFSTAASSGTGLGAIVRQCDGFDIHSRVGVGTVMVTRFHRLRGSSLASPAARCGAICLSRYGDAEPPPGAFLVRETGSSIVATVAEARGDIAPLVAQAALEAFAAELSGASPEKVRELALRLRETRDVKTLVWVLDRRSREAWSLGDLACSAEGAVLIASSIAPGRPPWLAADAGVLERDPALIAAVLYRAWARAEVPATVLVVRPAN
jgi:anti-sigma regulatory factor (Ser/Thr protein kinase)